MAPSFGFDEKNGVGILYLTGKKTRYLNNSQMRNLENGIAIREFYLNNMFGDRMNTDLERKRLNLIDLNSVNIFHKSIISFHPLGFETSSCHIL